MDREKTHHKETHGRSDGIDEDTPVDKVKGPNVFERAKEEIEALVETIHPKKKHDHDPPTKKDGKEVKTPNLHERAKEETEATMHKEKIHHKETHGRSNDIDEKTPINKVKGPSVLGRAKEEFEALVDAIHPKKEIDHKPQNKEKVGFWELLARWSENFCSPRSGKKD